MSILLLLLFMLLLLLMKHLGRKELCNEGSIGKIVLEILKEILQSSSSLSNEFFDLHPYGFCPITPSLTTNVFDELLWSTNGDEIYV